MNFISGCRGIRKIEYDVETVEQAELTSTFINEKTYLPLLELLIEIKKQTYRHVRTQRNHRQFIITYNQLLDQLIEKSRQFSIILHTWKKNGCQLFCTGDIENLDKAVKIYENFT